MTLEQIKEAAYLAFPDDEDRVREVSDENCPAGCIAWIGFSPWSCHVTLAEVDRFARALEIPMSSIRLQGDDDGLTIEVRP